MTQKEIAVDFLKLAGTGKVQEAYNKYVAPNFVHHNQYFKSDRQSLMNAMQEDHQSNPNTAIEVKEVFEANKKVITHSIVSKKDMEIVVIHIFKIDGNQIVELWDIGQVMMEDSPNEIGPF